LGQIDERVVGRRTLDIAARAGEIAERAGVDPERLEPVEGDMGARLPFGGDEGIAELGRIERARGRIGERGRAGLNCSRDLASPPRLRR
jgi:hypothetical protein